MAEPEPEPDISIDDIVMNEAEVEIDDDIQMAEVSHTSGAPLPAMRVRYPIPNNATMLDVCQYVNPFIHVYGVLATRPPPPAPTLTLVTPAPTTVEVVQAEQHVISGSSMPSINEDEDDYYGIEYCTNPSHSVCGDDDERNTTPSVVALTHSAPATAVNQRVDPVVPPLPVVIPSPLPSLSLPSAIEVVQVGGDDERKTAPAVVTQTHSPAPASRIRDLVNYWMSIGTNAPLPRPSTAEVIQVKPHDIVKAPKATAAQTNPSATDQVTTRDHFAQSPRRSGAGDEEGEMVDTHGPSPPETAGPFTSETVHGPSPSPRAGGSDTP